jgi:serine/threonine protein kinase
MSTAKISGETFLSLLRQSALIDIDQLRRLWKEVQEGGVDASDGTAIAEEFVRRGTITRWQADKLLQGKHKGFFIGKYRLLSHLGKGGMSSVYLAEHVLMRRRVAIKVLPSNRVDDSSYLQRFHREAQAVASLDHRNIVRAYDVDQEGSVHFLVMEFVPGQSMQELVAKQGPLSPVSAAEYIRQAAEGLAAAHKAGLVHRDIKPGNLLVDEKGTVKLLDLGLAMFFGEADKDTASLTIAHEEKVLGTADYLAPEQALDSHSVDVRADLYSLGGTLYFCLTGFPPFPEGTVAQRLMAHQAKQPKPISTYRPDVPESLVAVIDRMMQKKPDDRYQTAKDTSAALFQWLAQNGGDAWMKMSATASFATPASSGAPVTSGLSQAMPRVVPAGPVPPASAAEKSGSNLIAIPGGGVPAGSTVVQKESPRLPGVAIGTSPASVAPPGPMAPASVAPEVAPAPIPGTPDFSFFGAADESQSQAPTAGGFGLDDLSKAIAGATTPVAGPKSSAPSLTKAAKAPAPAPPTPPPPAPVEDPPTVIAKRAPVPVATAAPVATPAPPAPVVPVTPAAKPAETAPPAKELAIPDFAALGGSSSTTTESPAIGFDLAAAFGAAPTPPTTTTPPPAAVPAAAPPAAKPVVAQVPVAQAPVAKPVVAKPLAAKPVVATAAPVAKVAPAPAARPLAVPQPAPAPAPTVDEDNPFAAFGFGATAPSGFDPGAFTTSTLTESAPAPEAPVVVPATPVEEVVPDDSANEPEVETEVEPPPAASPRPARKSAGGPALPIKWIAGGVVGIALVAVGAWMFLGGGEDKPTKTVKKTGKGKTSTASGKSPKTAVTPFSLKRDLKVGPGEKFATVGAALADIKSEFATRKEDFDDAKRRVTRTIKLAPGATLSEAIVLDESFPPGVVISGDSTAPAALSPSGSGPAIKATGMLERLTIEHLKIDMGGKSVAIELTGFLNQFKLTSVEITGFAKTAIVVDGLTTYSGQRDRAVFEGVTVRGANPECVGLLLKKGTEDPAHIRVARSMFLGPMAAGAVAQASLIDVQFVECVFGQTTTGVRLEGDARQWKDVVFAHNTFHKGQRGVVFTHMPAPNSDGMAFYNNLFLEQGGPAVAIENNFQEGTFLMSFTKQGGGAQHNWTDAAEPPAPVPGVFNLFRSAGQWGVKDLKFVSTEMSSPDYLKPVEGSPLAKVARPASAEFTLERVGAR